MPQSLGRSRPVRLWMASCSAFLLLCCLPASPAVARESGSKHWSSSSDADAYILRLGDNTTSTNVSSDDYAGLREKPSGDFLWFRRAGKTYVIEDHATLEEARALFAPMRALEPEQEGLRRKEDALGEKERELDRQDEDLDRQVDRMTGDEGDEGDDDDDTGVTQIARISDADREELQRQLDELQSQQRDLQARQRDLESENYDLEKVERSLDAREDTLEREAESKLWTLIDGSIKKGLAKASPAP
jgi:hypothetical protein